MPITASYSSATRKLNALGDALANSIIFTRNPAGNLFINGGAVPITGGPATTINTDLIEAFGLDLNDVITLDQTNGTLPAANLSGGNSNDILTGGSNGDVLNGDAGVDTLIGQGGIDQLFGGADGDTMTGGDADDTMNGGTGNDRMIWNSGDDDDVMDGGDGSDIAEINGANVGENFSIAPDPGDPARIDFARTSPAAFTIDIGTTENLVLNAGGGNDTLVTAGDLSSIIALTIDGGLGNDNLQSGNGADLLLGGDGNDFIDGNQGPDSAFLGAGDDVFKWDPGDGSDIVEGQSDQDELLFNGSNASENIAIDPIGGRTRFLRDIAAITMDLNDVETVSYNALGGADNISIVDLTGTETTRININFAASAGGGDGQLDQVTVNATSGADSFGVTPTSGIDTFGLFALVHVTNLEATDRLVLSGLGGNDVIDASGIAAGEVEIELLGGIGADTLQGSAGDDLIFGGDGNDLALMGAGDDEFVWNPGDDLDTLEGQTGTDRMLFNGNGSVENITISNIGGRISFFRDVAAVTMDLNDVEQIIFNAAGGADTIAINDLSATDAALITLNLALAIGGSVGDSTTDIIAASGSGGADTVTLSGTGGVYTVTGLPYTLAVNTSEAGDILLVQSGAGPDVISAAGLAAGNGSLTLRGEGGNDIVTGSGGADLLQGGTENDTLTGGPGNDSMFGETGSDIMVWEPGDGSDVMEGGDGSDDVQIIGGNGAEAFVIAANGTRVAFNRVDPAPFALDIGTTEQLLLFANGGNDTISTSGNLAALIGLTINGGSGDDVILAGNGADILIAGDGNDFVDGNQSNDFGSLGAGNDVFQWDVGDGNDTVEGDADSDTLLFNGNGANENFVVSPNSGRATLTRDLGVVTMDLNNLEQIIINAADGTDNIDVNDMTGSEVTNVTVNLSLTIGGTTADLQFDTVEVFGTGTANIIEVIGTGSAAAVFGLAATVSVNQPDVTDLLIVQGLGGNDFINAISMSGGVVGLILDGGLGDDTLLGGSGIDSLFAGDGNDVVDGNFGGDSAVLGIGNDTFIWDPGDGSDFVNGDAGQDLLLFNGSNANENITITPNGSRAFFLRDVGSVSMDTDTVETMIYNAFGGTDNILIGNMIGTDVTRVIVNLAAATGGADGLADSVTVNATGLGDSITVTMSPSGAILVNGLFTVVEIRNFDTRDQLIINTGTGDDVVNASALDPDIAFQVNAGDGNDTLTGHDGIDIFECGLGVNSVFVSPGNDYVSSAGGVINIFP